jgi:ABC-type polysaccharide/polyol phosphate export permease
MYNFFTQAWATYKGLFYWLNWSGYISSILLRPVVVVIMYSILGRFALNPEAARDYALGITVYSMLFALLGGIVQSYSYERVLGTLSFLYVSPANRLVNFLSRVVFHYPNALLSFTTGLITAWLVAGIDFGPVNWTGFIISLLVTAASITAFVQFLGTFVIVLRDWLNTFGLILGILLVFTGVIIPIGVFPPALQEFCRILPMTNGLSAIRFAFAGATTYEVSLLILREALTGLVYLAIAFIGFRLFEYLARRMGTLEMETF